MGEVIPMPAQSLREAILRGLCTTRGIDKDITQNIRNELRDFLGHRAQYFSKDMPDVVQAAFINFIDHIFEEVQDGPGDDEE
jgi:hypothetical protein